MSSSVVKITGPITKYIPDSSIIATYWDTPKDRYLGYSFYAKAPKAHKTYHSWEFVASRHDQEEPPQFLLGGNCITLWKDQ